MLLPAGWQSSVSWSQQALRQYFRISGSLSLPLIWFLSPSPAASLTDAAAFWSTQSPPRWGETLKWPLKLHCNHTHLKTTRKCLPYASKPSVCVLVSRRGDYWQERESRAWIEELSGSDSCCPCLWSDLSEPLSCLSAWCLTSVWCSTGLREDQALPELALPLSLCNRSSANTSNTYPPPTHPFFRSTLWTNELFLSKNMCNLLDHKMRLNNSALPELVEQSQKNKKVPARHDSLITGHCTGIVAWSWWPLSLF